MQVLMESVNLSDTTLGAPGRERATEYLKVLRYLEHHREPATNLRAWAVSHNWHPKAADELEKLATKTFGTAGKPRDLSAETVQRLKGRWT
ncbi:hypothetical protein [Caenimonas soli]|uniref:hypothetical protein n=1 Tax=Caenimonas soli TaxID=2735555 RepID=UPI0015580301|nr:hypothetical protein [Caenimonas soli]NPC59150.1 hypothetical protein [Caenimonas soli]